MKRENIKVGDVYWTGHVRVRILSLDETFHSIEPMRGSMGIVARQGIKAVQIGEDGKPRRFTVDGTEYESRPFRITNVRELRRNR